MTDTQNPTMSGSKNPIMLPYNSDEWYMAIREYQLLLRKDGIRKTIPIIIHEATIIGIRELKKKIK